MYFKSLLAHSSFRQYAHSLLPRWSWSCAGEIWMETLLLNGSFTLCRSPTYLLFLVSLSLTHTHTMSSNCLFNTKQPTVTTVHSMPLLCNLQLVDLIFWHHRVVAEVGYHLCPAAGAEADRRRAVGTGHRAEGHAVEGSAEGAESGRCF